MPPRGALREDQTGENHEAAGGKGPARVFSQKQDAEKHPENRREENKNVEPRDEVTAQEKTPTEVTCEGNDEGLVEKARPTDEGAFKMVLPGQKRDGEKNDEPRCQLAEEHLGGSGFVDRGTAQENGRHAPGKPRAKPEQVTDPAVVACAVARHKGGEQKRRGNP